MVRTRILVSRVSVLVFHALTACLVDSKRNKFCQLDLGMIERLFCFRSGGSRRKSQSEKWHLQPTTHTEYIYRDEINIDQGLGSKVMGSTS